MEFETCSHSEVYLILAKWEPISINFFPAVIDDEYGRNWIPCRVVHRFVHCLFIKNKKKLLPNKIILINKNKKTFTTRDHVFRTWHSVTSETSYIAQVGDRNTFRHICFVKHRRWNPKKFRRNRRWRRESSVIVTLSWKHVNNILLRCVYVLCEHLILFQQTVFININIAVEKSKCDPGDGRNIGKIYVNIWNFLPPKHTYEKFFLRKTPWQNTRTN